MKSLIINHIGEGTFQAGDEDCFDFGLENDEELIALRPSDLKMLKESALELCYQIESCGASEPLTKASLMASALNKAIESICLKDL